MILFMDVYKVGSTTAWSVALGFNFGGFVSFLAGLFGFILAGTDIRRNSYGQFWSTKIQSDGQFCASETQTDRRTHS